jgi:hypothetical protein
MAKRGRPSAFDRQADIAQYHALHGDPNIFKYPNSTAYFIREFERFGKELRSIRDKVATDRLATDTESNRDRLIRLIEQIEDVDDLLAFIHDTGTDSLTVDDRYRAEAGIRCCYRWVSLEGREQ